MSPWEALKDLVGVAAGLAAVGSFLVSLRARRMADDAKKGVAVVNKRVAAVEDWIQRQQQQQTQRQEQSQKVAAYIKAEHVHISVKDSSPSPGIPRREPPFSPGTPARS